MVHHEAVRRHQDDLQPHVAARLLTGAGSGCVGTAAQEHDTYQPSASLETVIVLGAPWRGRLRLTATRPILLSTRTPLSNRAPLPHSLSVQLS
jgi:hypothetical protein